MKTAILTLCFCLVFAHTFAQGVAEGGTIANTADQSTPGKTWGVVVGISKYKNIQGLNYADRDAQVFYDYLVKTDGGPKIDPSQVKLLLNENALSAEIYGALHLSGCFAKYQSIPSKYPLIAITKFKINLLSCPTLNFY